MRIVVDDRERRSGIIEILKRTGLDVTIKRLLYGDYLIDGQLVVERKTANDFAASVMSGRLFRQIRELKKIPLRVVLMVEGNLYRTKHAIEPDAVRGALISISAAWQVPVIFSASMQDSVTLLRTIAAQLETSQEVVSLRGGYRPKRLINKQLFILQGLPGVGARLAIKLLYHFRDVAHVFSASSEDLIKVDGLGPVKARRIRDVLDVEIK